MYLNKLEVLRYLGYNNQNIDTNIQNLLDECIYEIGEISQERFIYDTYPIEKLDDLLTFKNTTLTTHSKDVANHLSQSNWCTLMAATLGLEVDKKITYYAKVNMTKSVILDACASTAIESLCDEAQEKIRQEAHGQGYHITSRFSPGYGDFPITLQKEFVAILKAYPKMGLTVNESSIMLPRKSVTALIGWQKDKCTSTLNNCNQCLKKDCLYRKDKDHIEHSIKLK